MDKKKIISLRRHGWRVGNTADFLALSDEEAAYVELKIVLAQFLRKRRKDRKLTQQQLAKLVHSSQSRIVKMEKNDPSVSIDLLVRTLLVLGVSRSELGRAMSYKAAA